MKSKFTIAAFFLAVYVFFLVAMLPANWLLAKIQLPEDVLLVDVQGSIWQTTIKQVVVDDIVIDDVKSSLSPFSLILLNPSVEVSFGNTLVNGPQGYLTVSGFFSDVNISDAVITLPADMVAAELDLAVDVIAHEQLKIDINDFTVGAPVCSELAGNLFWQNAAVTALDERVSLGSLSAKLSCDKGELVANVEPKNNLGLSYRARLKADGEFTGSGYLKPGANFPSQLREVLSFLGSADQQGRYRLSL